MKNEYSYFILYFQWKMEMENEHLFFPFFIHFSLKMKNEKWLFIFHFSLSIQNGNGKTVCTRTHKAHQMNKSTYIDMTE